MRRRRRMQEEEEEVERLEWLFAGATNKHDKDEGKKGEVYAEFAIEVAVDLRVLEATKSLKAI